MYGHENAMAFTCSMKWRESKGPRLRVYSEDQDTVGPV